MQRVTGTCGMAHKNCIPNTTICLGRECRRCGWVTDTMHLTIVSGNDMMPSVHCRMTESLDKSSLRQRTSGVIFSWDETNTTLSTVEALASFLQYYLYLTYMEFESNSGCWRPLSALPTPNLSLPSLFFPFPSPAFLVLPPQLFAPFITPLSICLSFSFPKQGDLPWKQWEGLSCTVWSLSWYRLNQMLFGASLAWNQHSYVQTGGI